MNEKIIDGAVIHGKYGSILIDYDEAESFIAAIKEAKRRIELIHKMENASDGILRIQRNCN